MNIAGPNCAKCGAHMEDGYVLDNTHGGRVQSVWIEGEPETSRWTGLKVKDRLNLPITTYRCSKCGYLESYARSE